jgi:AcrR family transcriptional regulator
MKMNDESTGRRGRSQRPRAGRASVRGEVAEVFRRAILDAAERVFGRHGFTEAKVAEIADEAGLAAGTLYKYFDGKEGIFRTLLEHRGEEFAHRLEEQATQPGRDPCAKLARLTEAVLAYVESRVAMFRMFEEVGSSADGYARGMCGQEARQLQQRYVRLFEDCLAEAGREGMLAEGLSHRELAEAFTGSIKGVVGGWLMRGRKGRLTARASFLVDLFLCGAGAKGPRGDER